MRGQLMDSWDEKMVYDVTRGVPKDNLDEFTDSLAESLGLDEQQCRALRAKMKPMAYAEAKVSQILEMSFNIDKFKSIYGFVSMVRENDGTIAIAYAFHKLTFKMAAKLVKETETKKTKKEFLFWEITPEVTTSEAYRKEQVKFGEKDIDAIKKAFGRHKALETLKQEGIITAIKYED